MKLYGVALVQKKYRAQVVCIDPNSRCTESCEKHFRRVPDVEVKHRPRQGVREVQALL